MNAKNESRNVLVNLHAFNVLVEASNVATLLSKAHFIILTSLLPASRLAALPIEEFRRTGRKG